MIPLKREFSLVEASDAPRPTCGHILCEGFLCPECAKLIHYLYDKFGLDSWVHGKRWWLAWFAVKRGVTGGTLRELAIAAASPEEIREIEEWKRAWKKLSEVQCHWCKDYFPPKRCHADHVTPLSRGGDHALRNLVVACRNCNLTKQAMMPNDWMRLLKAVTA